MAAILVAGCGDGTGPDWRVREGHIGYSQWRWDDHATPRFSRIYRVRPDGSDRSVLLPGFQDSGLVANELALSPDGGSLAFSAQGGGYVARLADDNIRVEPGLTGVVPAGAGRACDHSSLRPRLDAQRFLLASLLEGLAGRPPRELLGH